MTFKPDLIISHILDGLKYWHVTVILALVPCTIATILGLGIALARFFGYKGISATGSFFTIVSKSVPSVLMMFIFYYGTFAIIRPLAQRFPDFISIKNVSAYAIALVALTFGNLGFVTETMTSAARSVNKGQLEAALMSGMTNFQAVRRILFPQIMKVAVPNLCNNYTASIKLSAIAFTISVVDMLNGALIKTYKTYSYLECYLGVAALYWVLVFLVEKMFLYFEYLTNVKERRQKAYG